MGDSHAVVVVSGDAQRAAGDGLEMMKCEGLRVCSLEAEEKFNAKWCRSSVLRYRCGHITDLSHLPRAARLIAYSRRCALVSTHQTCSGPRTRSGLRPPLHEPTRPANPASQPPAATQSQALPSKAYRRLPPQVVQLVVVWVIVVLLLSENDRTTCACVLLLLAVYILSGRMILPDISA